MTSYLQLASLLLLLSLALASAAPASRQQRRDLVHSASSTLKHNTMGDPLANYLQDIEAAEQQLIHEYENKVALLKEAATNPHSDLPIEVPVPEQLPADKAHPRLEQLPADTHLKPEQLPADTHPQSEQVPADTHPKPEQVPADTHPQPEHLPADTHPQPEQVPADTHPAPEQLPADTHPQTELLHVYPEGVPEQVPELPENDGRVSLPALPEHINPEPVPYKVSTSKRSVRSERLTEFLDELTEENMALANNIRLKLRILQQAIESPVDPELLDTTQSAKGSSDPEFERFLRGMSGPDANLLKKFQSRLHLVREALHMPKNEVKKSPGFGDFVPLEQMPTHKSKEKWGDAPLPDSALGLVEEGRCIGGKCHDDLQKPVNTRAHRIAAELLAAKQTSPRLRSLLERLTEERRHDTIGGLEEQQLEDLAKRKRSIH